MYKEFLPSASLRDNVSLYYILDLPEYNGAPRQHLVTPDGCIELNFVLGAGINRTDSEGNVTLTPQHYVVSRFKEHYYAQRTGPVKVIGIRFHPWGWQHFAKVPTIPHDVALPAGEIFPGIKKYAALLQQAVDNNAVIAVLEEYCKTHYSNSKQVHPAFEYACKIMAELNGDADMNAVCNDYHISRRRLQQLFRQYIDITPKCFSRMLKFRYSLRLLQKKTFSKLSDIAYLNGYTDQSHFIKDFKTFSGLNPHAYISEDTILNDLMTGADIHFQHATGH